MKPKILFICFILVFYFMGLPRLPGSEISSPAKNAQWCRGKPHTIMWNWAYFNASQVKILLYRGRTRIKAISQQISNNGNFLWRIPTDLPEANNYHVVIRIPGQNVYTQSEEFTIKFCGLRRQNDPQRPVNRQPPGQPQQMGPQHHTKIPDLKITDLSFNASNTLITKIKNIGRKRMSAAINNKLDVTTHTPVNIFGGGGGPPEPIQISLNPGQQKEYSLPFFLDTGFYNTQNHQIKVKFEANSDQKVPELTFSNNKLESYLKPNFRLYYVSLGIEKTSVHGNRMYFELLLTFQASLQGNFTFILKSNHPRINNYGTTTLSAIEGMMKNQATRIRSVYLDCEDKGNYWIEIHITHPNYLKSNRVGIQAKCNQS